MESIFLLYDMSLRIVLFFMCQAILAASSSVTSRYVKTTVIEESNGCSFLEHNSGTEREATTVLECGKLCSKDEDCRRFMFDESERSCSIYGSGENCIAAANVDKKVCYMQKSVCNDTDCIKCPIGFYGYQCELVIKDCAHGKTIGVVPDKKMLSFIQPLSTGPVIEVLCFFKYQMTYMVRRDIRCKEVRFNRRWEEYYNGFGSAHGEYWMGLRHIYNFLQAHKRANFQVVIDTITNVKYMAYYQNFNLTQDQDSFRITLGPFKDFSPKKLTGDSLTNGTMNIKGRPFSTFDRDFSRHNCSKRFGSGWWYVDDNNCSRANLLGKRQSNNFEKTWHWQDTKTPASDFRELIVRCRVIDI